MRSSRYVFFGAALHWLAVFVFLEAVSSGMGSKKHVVYWNTTNPIFRIDNTDHIIDVNRGNIPYEYDQVNLVCPSYTPSTPEDEAEKYIIYNVSKEEFDTCRITNPNPRIIAVCDKPHKLLYFTITFRSFTPQPGGLEFRPGQDYYFISTSSKDDLHRRIGGRCKTSNMRIVFKVCCKPGEEPEHQRPAIKGDKKELTVGKNGTMDATSSTQGHPPAAGMDLPSNNVDSSAEPTDRQPPQHHLRHDDTDISGTRLAEEFSRIPTLSGGASNGGGNQRWSPPRVLTTRRPGSSSFDDLLGSNDLPTDYLGRNPASDSSLSISTSEPPFKNKNFGYPIFSVKSTNKKPDFKYDRSGNEVVKEELSSSASTNLLRHRELCLALAFLVAFFLPRVHVR